MTRSTELGSELEADHRLIELLFRQLQLESDATRRQAMVNRITAIVDWHEAFDRRYLEASAGAGAGDGVGADGSLDAVIARAQQHIREEEEHTLPAFERHVNWMVLEDLGERAREFRLASTPG